MSHKFEVYTADQGSWVVLKETPLKNQSHYSTVLMSFEQAEKLANDLLEIVKRRTKPFIMYAGARCKHKFTLEEKTFQREGQALIDEQARRGRLAAFIHRGEEHDFYIEVVDGD